MPAENIINGHLFLRNGLLNEKDINQALNAAVSQIDKNAHYFGSEYPTPAATKISLVLWIILNGRTVSGQDCFG